MENVQVYDLKCTISHVIFQRDLFAICVCETASAIPPEAVSDFDMLNNRYSFVALGDGLCTERNREVVLSGSWNQNPKKEGLQLRISDCRDYVGQGRDAVVSYLQSGVLKGIGQRTAELIYDKFGEESLSVIETDPKKLLSIPGIKEKRLTKLVASYEANRELHSLSMLLSKHGVSYRTIVRIHKTLGEGSAAMVRTNPYVLCRVSGFGFQSADEIALRMGNFADSDFRIAGGTEFALSDAQSKDGHLFLTRGVLVSRCASEDILNSKAVSNKVTPEQIDAVIDKMLAKNELVRGILSSDEAKTPAQKIDQRIYLPAAYKHESLVATAIANKLGEPIAKNDWKTAVQKMADELEVHLDEKQAEAAVMGLSRAISVITGGPGTGKTTGLRVLVKAFLKAYPKKWVALAAPTGRAARRMAGQIGLEASTLHSLLGLRPDTHTNFNAEPSAEEMVDADLLVIDESSMIDASLMAELMYRVKKGTQVIFLGDVDQLPSVGPGNVLRQMLACPSIPHVRLEKIFRQADGSIIPVNAASIKNGRNDLIESKFFKIVACRDEHEGAQVITRLIANCMDKGMVGQTQILCPMKRRGDTCTSALNAALRDIVNPPSPTKNEGSVGGESFRVGDKVIQTRNIDGASNGDIGFVTDIQVAREGHPFMMRVQFETGDPVEYDYEGAMDLDHALAITIHKSQGSEFPAVVVPMFKSMRFFLKRNLLYTAVTRASIQVVVVTDRTGVEIAIRQEDNSKRNTLLAHLVLDAMQAREQKVKMMGIDAL